MFNIRLFFILAVFTFHTFTNFVFSDSLKKKHIVFIVNPISHELKGQNIRKLIDKNLDHDQFDYQIVYTQHPQHATELTQKALQESADIIAAVGGDGTVNEVGKALINKEAALAIIPVGSGNGLARHLGIPVGLTESIKALNHAQPTVIDTAKINDQTFLGVAGIGFDALIAQKFSQFGKRGFFSYLQVVLQEFSNYEAQSYLITIDGKQISRKAFILTLANSSQYGNDFIIAPKARIHDGYLDLVIVDDIPGYDVPEFVYKFKQGTLDDYNHYETHRFKEILIQQQNHQKIQAHADGEPLLFQDQLKVTIQPDSLKIMVPSSAQYLL